MPGRFMRPPVREGVSSVGCRVSSVTSPPDSRHWASTLGPSSARRLAQLLQYRRVLQGRDVLLDLLALGDGAQQPAHDLAGAGLGQVVAEADVLGLGDRPDLL